MTMAKIKQRYLAVHPDKIIEEGFHPERNEVSESIFSLSNEYMGVRGSFEEGISLPSLVGTYFNGIYEYAKEETPNAYKGIVKRTHFTINSTNAFKIELSLDGTRLDLAKIPFSGFRRELDLRSGESLREFTWDGKARFRFSRLLSMDRPHEAVQRIEIESLTNQKLDLSFFLDGTVVHWGKDSYYDPLSSLFEGGEQELALKTLTTGQSLTTRSKIIASKEMESKTTCREKDIETHYETSLGKGEKLVFTRYIVNVADKHAVRVACEAKEELKTLVARGYGAELADNKAFFEDFYSRSDIQIEGDDEDQQGIRYCLFQLVSAYHGYEEDNNIGAKGLTGEAYSGHAFWDSETYCLPYYLFSNQKAAKDLLLFRYHTLEEAKERAKELDCEGACFPIATRNGKEACNLWQHASTQFQPTTAVAYAISHYMNLYHDEEFMVRYGLEMLIEIAKFLLTRGQYNQNGTQFGFYGVMGPDEFEVMVNHNAYTNFMAKKSLDYLLGLLENPVYQNAAILKKYPDIEAIKSKAAKASACMKILYDPATKLFEQHEGFFDLPHIDVDAIPVTDFPLYSHWSYDRIYRNDMIKQPDVLMFMFLYPHDFSKEQLKANYEYYEPRCIHESSLSPSIHSILACALDKDEEAMDFFGFATRLDLDDYNRNTREGLHMTSIAAAWMNIVYGFLGLQSDAPVLAISPKIPTRWKAYSVNLVLANARLRFRVTEGQVTIAHSGEPVDIEIWGKRTRVDRDMTVLK